jgi:hypothetical protein
LTLSYAPDGRIKGDQGVRVLETSMPPDAKEQWFQVL